MLACSTLLASLSPVALTGPEGRQLQPAPDTTDVSEDRTLRNAGLHNTSAPEWLAINETLRKCASRHSQNQFGEELTLLAYLTHITRGQPGSFVEIGALDGFRYSNTWALESCLGWRGLLIEGNPKNCQRLQENLSKRPKCKAVCSAVCDEVNGKVNFTRDGDALAGMPDHMNEGYKDRWGKLNHPNKTVEVKCTRMNLLMKNQANLQAADFLTLDVEGAEDFVLSASRIEAFKLILVETGGGISKGVRAEKRARILDMLKQANFVRPTAGSLAKNNSIFNSEVFVRADVAAHMKALRVVRTASAPHAAAKAPEREPSPPSPTPLAAPSSSPKAMSLDVAERLKDLFLGRIGGVQSQPHFVPLLKDLFFGRTDQPRRLIAPVD